MDLIGKRSDLERSRLRKIEGRVLVAKARETSTAYDISGVRESADQTKKNISTSNRNIFEISETEDL